MLTYQPFPVYPLVLFQFEAVLNWVARPPDFAHDWACVYACDVGRHLARVQEAPAVTLVLEPMTPARMIEITERAKATGLALRARYFLGGEKTVGRA